MGKSFYSVAVYDITEGEKISIKLMRGILLLVSILLAETAQTIRERDLEEFAATGISWAMLPGMRVDELYFHATYSR